MTADIVTLQTARLILRGHRASDLADCAAMWGDPLVTRHLGGPPLGREEVWTKLLRYLGHWSVMGFGFWVITDRASGRFVGEVGFGDFRRELEEPFTNAPEMGWVLASWAHGRGFASEAARAALEWGDEHLPGRRTLCLVHPENAASIRVASKLGYQEYGRTFYKGAPAVAFERRTG